MDLTLFLYSMLRSGFLTSAPSFIAVIAVLSYYLLTVFGLAKIFEKAGRNPYNALIPLYQYYELFSIAWKGGYGVLFGFTEVLYIIFSFGKGRLLSRGIIGILCVALFVFSLVLLAIAKIKLSLSFKKSPSFCYGLIFMETVFFLVLGLDKSKYYGPTLRKYAVVAKEEDPDTTRAYSGRRYLITLHKRRSVIALVSGGLMLFFACRAIAMGLLNSYIQIQRDTGYNLFHFFTINSNLLLAISTSFIIPYAIEGIRKKRFVFPRWVTILEYSATTCTTLTMLFAFLFIYPSSGPELAFGGMNFWLHVICPIMAIGLFFLVETDVKLSLSDSMIALIPFFLYSLIYIFNVVLIGEEYGGWKDIYLLTAFLPAAMTAPMMYMFGFGVASLLRFAYNKLVTMRYRRFIDSWSDDTSEIEVNIEVYGLGRYHGKHFEPNNIGIPIDIFNALSEKYGLDPNKLSVIYNKGLFMGMREKAWKAGSLRKRLVRYIGVPEQLQKKETPKTETV